LIEHLTLLVNRAANLANRAVKPLLELLLLLVLLFDKRILLRTLNGLSHVSFTELMSFKCGI
jgi:hypothetical protein